ncbi:hypothetical protein Bca52824_080436 [Brassica carinata]|uniref:Amino acid transporter transmembrane domain-containing protein n=1 Tax=Brassica carinata TaxID=52824 RepID=A0A8X7PFH4_BRACI|nr:hypothetical protein Bca52824_080436 [Brassica carinata]
MIVQYRFKSYTSLLLSMKATDKRLSCSTVCKRHYSHDKKELDESLQRELANKPNQQALFNLGQIRFQSFSVVSRFYIGISLPFLSSLASLLGGLTLSVTFAYPCFTWVLIKKPTNYSFSGYFHWVLGCLGVAFSLTLSIGDIWSMVKLKFFSPKVKLMFKVSGFFLL